MNKKYAQWGVHAIVAMVTLGQQAAYCQKLQPSSQGWSDSDCKNQVEMLHELSRRRQKLSLDVDAAWISDRISYSQWRRLLSKIKQVEEVQEDYLNGRLMGESAARDLDSNLDAVAQALNQARGGQSRKPSARFVGPLRTAMRTTVSVGRVTAGIKAAHGRKVVFTN